MGQNIHYSLSPKIHHYWMEHYSLKGTYDLVDIDEENLPQILGQYQGGNVTTPYKEKVIPLMDCLTPLARLVGAVNTIYLSDDKWIGDNTDCLALIEVIKGFPQASKAMILGSGGAAKAALVALQDLTIKSVICSRTQTTEAWIPWAERHPRIQEVNVIINATPLGLNDQGSPLDFLPSHPCLVVDMVYQPRCTPLIKLALECQHMACDGLEVLVRQARHSFNRWWGILPDYEPVWRFLQ